MTATNGIRRARRLCGTTPALLVAMAVGTFASPSTAAVSNVAEFGRITADIRAAVVRHDSRALHQFEEQLHRLIAEATGR